MATDTTADNTGLAETAAVTAEAAADDATDVQTAADEAAAAPEPEVQIDEEVVAEEIAAEVDPAIAKLNAGLVAMVHPEGGTCDLYKADAKGNILVPASEIVAMQDHGFVTVVAHTASEA